MRNDSEAPFLRRNVGRDDIGATLSSFVDGKLMRLGFPVLVKVEAVHDAGVSITGKVDVLPLVQQQDARTQFIERNVIHDVPYLRVQGGTSALIIDPQPGDIGFIVIAGRDMTHAITNRGEGPPASFRCFSMSDAVYVGGFLNDAPSQYIQATADGWRIVTPGNVTVQAGGDVSIHAASVTADCDITTSGDVKAGSVSLKGHKHSGVQPGGGSTGAPE